MIRYLIRMEPGVQTPEETLDLRRRLLPRYGVAAGADPAAHRPAGALRLRLSHSAAARTSSRSKAPPAPTRDFTDLHAWTEVYLPGAGWVGLDPTSGLLCGEGHLPVAATPHYRSAAPISGLVEPSARSSFAYEMSVKRIAEQPRVTMPFSDEAWDALDALGEKVDADLNAHDVRLTMGGEPTFVSVDDYQSAEWNTAALGPTKRVRADELIRRLRDRFAPGGLLHYGQGKWYPGEPLPRWAFSLYWRRDGVPIWRDESLIAREAATHNPSVDDAQQLRRGHCRAPWNHGGLRAARLRGPGRPDAQARPDPGECRSERSQDRRSARARPHPELVRQPSRPAGRLRAAGAALDRAGEAGMVERAMANAARPAVPDAGRFAARLPPAAAIVARTSLRSTIRIWSRPTRSREQKPLPDPRITHPIGTYAHARVGWRRGLAAARARDTGDAESARAQLPATRRLPVRTALSVEARDGRLCVFMPPVETLEDYLELLAVVESTAAELSLPVHVEGYAPPPDPRLNVIKVTPDPGVIEVNIHPAASWREAVEITTRALRGGAPLAARHRQVHDRRPPHRHRRRQSRRARRPQRRPTARSCAGPICSRAWCSIGSGGRRSPISFPACSSARPARRRASTKRARTCSTSLKSRSRNVPPAGRARRAAPPPWLVDRLFRNILVDVTGNTHRTEICIDKLFSPDGPTGRLGLVEFRSFEMPPDARMSLAQQLLLRALVAWFWRAPLDGTPVRWGTALHDRFMLEHFVWNDFLEVLDDLDARRLRVRSGLVRGAAPIPLPALRHASSTAACGSNCGRRSSPGTCSARRARPAAPRASSIPRSSGCRSRSRA